MMQRRSELVPIMLARASEDGTAFALLGAERAFDFAVVKAPNACGAIPSADATGAEKLFAFFDVTLGDVHGWFGDAELSRYAPYYFQSATELGGPAYAQQHLLDLLPGGAPVEGSRCRTGSPQRVSAWCSCTAETIRGRRGRSR
jgi:hypothetical protein